MRRREFITLLGAAAAWPLSARAQQAGKIYRIGFLANDPTIPNTAAGTAFLEGLREGGFIEGKNILVDWRFAEGRGDRYAHLAETFVRLQMDLIVTSAVSATIAAKQATRNIPIVMLNVADPVGQGIIASLAFPEANITGLVQDESPEIAPKRLQLLKDALPQISRVAVLMQPDASYAQSEWKVLEPAARSLRMTLQAIAVRQINEFEGAFIGMTRDRPDALLVSNSELNFTHRRLILQFAGESAVLFLPLAVLVTPKAAALVLFAVLVTPNAVLFLPAAVLVTPMAVALVVFAVLVTPNAVLFLPLAVLSTPMAVLFVPLATLGSPIAVLFLPLAVLRKPTAVVLVLFATFPLPTDVLWRPLAMLL
jgi:putative ABC transport system substrate-binding protein